MQLNSDLQPFVKSSAGEPASFSLTAAPMVFHRQIVGEEKWHQQLQQVLICDFQNSSILFFVFLLGNLAGTANFGQISYEQKLMTKV